MFNNEIYLVYFQLNYVAGRGLCIACNTLRMLVIYDMDTLHRQKILYEASEPYKLVHLITIMRKSNLYFVKVIASRHIENF
jgi:hypothetical protein